MVLTAALKAAAIFNDLADYELENIAKLAQQKTYETGHRIFAEGALAQRMYILLDGEVEIRIRPNSEAEQMTVDTINKGEIFGWSALTQPYSLSAAAWVTKPSTVIEMSGDSLRDLFVKNNHIGYVVTTAIASTIAIRLKNIRQRMLELLHSRKSER
jgi:CRP-like cAMP-binding protein